MFYTEKELVVALIDVTLLQNGTKALPEKKRFFSRVSRHCNWTTSHSVAEVKHRGR